MKWLKILGGLLLVLVLALAAIPFFISLDDYIPRIEQEVSARIKEPVKIGSLRAGGLPLPHMTVRDITVGKSGDIKVGKVTVTPDLWSLTSATRVIKNIEIDGLVLTQKALDKIPAWIPPAPKPGAPVPPPAVRVQAIKLEDAVVRLQKASVGPFDARLSLSGEGNLVSASLATRDGKLKAHVKPDGPKYLIDASAKGWTVPMGAPIHFDELLVKGVATMKDANFSNIRAKLYGGTVSGNATAAWHKGIQARGSAEVNQVEIAPVLKALGRPASLSGKLTAKPVTFSASAARADQLVNALRMESPFDVQNGVLNGVDVQKAATSFISKDGGKGGQTRFDRLSGHLAMDRGTRRLTRLNVVSGSLSGEGNVTISPKDELSGRITARVKATSLASAAVPLNVAGTLESPLLYPTGGTVAGAAVGTAIAGPLGTAAGAKVGQWAEGLFGKKDEKKK
jgi:uncharacterized protein involved in outer membrane biogenesis